MKINMLVSLPPPPPVSPRKVHYKKALTASTWCFSSSLELGTLGGTKDMRLMITVGDFRHYTALTET